MQKIIELRASNAHRWMVCNGQPQAVADLPDNSGQAADRGTVAHALLELMLRLDMPADEIDRYANKAILRTIDGRRADHILVDDDMMDGVGHALDYVRGYLAKHPKADFEPESLLDASSFIGKESGGTSDVILHDLPRELVIVDYKNGINHVEHEDNDQLYIYALGAIDKYSDKVTPKTKIRMVIVQPNTRENTAPIRETVVGYYDVIDFGKRAAAAAKEAYSKNPKRVAGEHCNYCKAAGSCKTYADRALSAAAIEFGDVHQHVGDALANAATMSEGDIARILTAAKQLRHWLDNVENEAVRRLLANQDISGYKVVASRTHRRWDDADRVANIIKTYAPTRALELAPPMPLTPAAMERRLQHARDGDLKLLQRLQKNVTRNPSEPKVAPVDDSRPPYKHGSEFTKEK